MSVVAFESRDKFTGGFSAAVAAVESVISSHQEYEPELRAYLKTVDGSWQEVAEAANDFAKIYKKLSKYYRLRSDLERVLKQKAVKSGMEVALKWFKRFELKYLRINTSSSFITVETHDRALVDEAAALAMKCERMVMDELKAIKARGATGKYCMKSAERIIIAICEGVGVDCPVAGIVPDEQTEMLAKCARLFDESWWRRKLRKLQARRLEHAARLLGMVNKPRGGYCSSATLYRRKSQKNRNAELLENMEATNELGQVYTLAELSELGVSNPVLRRAELMTRIRGFEEVAKEIGGWVPVFFTQTCPSRYHSHSRGGVPYPEWDGSTPRDAQEYLTGVWARVRSKFNRDHIPCFGFRVSEPHHDGCPHWHSLLWFPSHQVDKAIAIYEAYAMEDTPPKRKSVRFKAMRDELASGATNYIAKYISKNVDGLTESGEAWSKDAVSTAIRTEAWASTWGIRQFQQIGGPSVTVWREMRRLSGEFAEAEEVEAIRKASDEGDWCQFTIEMGGPVCPLKDRPVRANMVMKKEQDELTVNKYGEHVLRLIGLMAFGWLPVRTRVHEWVVRPVKKRVLAFQEAQAPPLDLCQ